MGLFHLGFNMFALWNFGPIVVYMVGKENFWLLYLGGAGFSSLISLIYKKMRRISIPSLGASGVVFSVVWVSANLFPEQKLSFIFLPFFSFDSYPVVFGLAIFDTLGLVFQWSRLDHAAHLGGALFGLAFYHFLRLTNGFSSRYLSQTYEGQTVDGKMHGRGKLTFADGHLVYEGNFKNNRFHGYGTLSQVEETGVHRVIYSGSWVDGKLDGAGEFHKRDGLVFKGNFNQTPFPIGIASVYAKGRLIFRGEFEPHGQRFKATGTWYPERGEPYEVVWIEGTEPQPIQ